MSSFEALGLRAETLQSLTTIGFTTPTPVQEQAIPLLLTTEKDVVALAQTGTGKTAAFGLPMLEFLDPQDKTIQSLILAPTRELCVQIAKDLERFSANLKGTRIVAVYGGASIRDQIRDIQRGAQIIVATPGRLLDLIGRGVMDLTTVGVVVLDEADEMLNMGFQEDLTEILEKTPENKKTWLFSATMSSDVRRIAKRYMREFEEVSERTRVRLTVLHREVFVHGVSEERDRNWGFQGVDRLPKISDLVSNGDFSARLRERFADLAQERFAVLQNARILVVKNEFDFFGKRFFSREQSHEERDRSGRGTGAEVDDPKGARFFRLFEGGVDRFRMLLKERDEFRRLERKKIEEVTRAVLLVSEVVLEVFRARVGE